MARRKAFDPEDVVERAMQTFWTHGFEATSTEDLERELGINRSSIYATFRSKGQLYERALERYTSGMRGPGDVRPEALAGPEPVRRRVEAMLWRVVDADLCSQRSRGCFAGNAAIERGPRDERIRRLVSHSFAMARAVLRDELTRAREYGELRADADVDALASMLVAVIEGLTVLAKGTRDRELLGRAIAGAVAAL